MSKFQLRTGEFSKCPRSKEWALLYFVSKGFDSLRNEVFVTFHVFLQL